MYKIYVICYNLKLGSGCNSGKDLSKNEENDQLVKCKDTGIYLLYIYQLYMRQLSTMHESISHITIRKEQ